MTQMQTWSSKELEFLQNLDPFCKLPEALREETVNTWERCTAAPGELIIQPGQTEHTHLFVVFDGMVRVTGGPTNRANAGQPQRPILGIRESLHGGPSEYEALVALPTNYARLPGAWFRGLMEKDKDFEAIFRREYPQAIEQPETNGSSDHVIKQPFAFLQAWHGDRPWGSVLDAGTGELSLRWIMGLPTERWAAVTGDPHWTRRLKAQFGSSFREQDKLIEHNWTDASLLKEEKFDVVIADYLLGAIERFAPYFQIKLWPRLRPHVGSFLYITGLEPLELSEPETSGGEMIKSIVRLRDSLMLMVGKPRFREYPLFWVQHTLREAGFAIETTENFPKQFGAQEINAILDNCLRLLPDLNAPDLALAMAYHINSLRQEAMSLPETHLGIRLGNDYAVVARPV